MKRLMAMLATLALVAAAFTSCDKDDPKPKPKPQPLDPSYLPGKNFEYEKKVGDDTKAFAISFGSGTDRTFEGRKQHFIDKPGADFLRLYEGYRGIYTIQGNKITAKLRHLARDKKVGDNATVYEDFDYEAGQEPVLFEAEVNAQEGTITLRAWDQTIVLKLAPTPA